MENNESLIIIPARGGSKGIPRKNLRPLAGHPLIYYVIKATKDLAFKARTIVTTDDEEIAKVSEYYGVDVIFRNKKLSNDSIPLDPVIFDAFQRAEKKYNEKYNYIFTIQPTSPLIELSDLEESYRKITTSNNDSIITVAEKYHHFWIEKEKELKPFHKKRLNRQFLSPIYEEVGAIIGCSRQQILTKNRLGKKVSFQTLENYKAVDIDDEIDFKKCEALLTRKVILFNIIGNKEFGLGHIYRALTIANELIGHKIIFLFRKTDDLAVKLIKQSNFKYHIIQKNKIIEFILNLKPDCVINDILDTENNYTSAISKNNILQINFEDLGIGNKNADLVINALYPNSIKSKKILSGEKYFCLRNEFYWSKFSQFNNKISNILISFGGTDPHNLTLRVIKLIAKDSVKNNIKINIVCGPGYLNIKKLKIYVRNFKNIDVIESTRRISDYMTTADIAFTAGGRTVYELLSMHVPAIVICSNVRETSHIFANIKNGVINLGHHQEVTDKEIYKKFEELAFNEKFRYQIYNIIKKIKLRDGKRRVIQKIQNLLMTERP